MRTPDDLTKLVNQSGFPLQLKIDALVEQQSDQIGWKVLYREHGWTHPNGQSGFIDLVLEDRHGTSVLVVECKRVLEADWVFLDSTPPSQPTKRTRLWAVNTAGRGRQFSGYFDARSAPESQESMYCVVAGQDSKARPMLERLAAEVTAATEALAIEEHPAITKRNYGLRMYASVIVTTAQIHLSRFDAHEVSMKTGEATTVTHAVLPWIRFRKQLSSEFAVEPKNMDWDFSELALAKEKQTFVVNLESLPAFLEKWEIASNSLRPLM
jgi:hypothetical protein